MIRTPESKTLILFFVALLLLILLIGFSLQQPLWLALAVWTVFAAAAFMQLKKKKEEERQQILKLNDILGEEVNDALIYGDVGLVVCDEKFDITWMSDFFIRRNINFIGEGILRWLPELRGIFDGDQDEIVVEYDKRHYRVSRKPDSAVLFFVDITDLFMTQEDRDSHSVVLGLINLDNYEEATQYEEETDITLVDSVLKQPVVRWAMDHNMIIKKIKNDRYMIVLNEEIYQTLVQEQFSILDEIREASAGYPIPITLSIAIARGSNNFSELDEMLNSLLQLAQSRGGDQVASKKFGEDTVYFGGKSQAQEKSSRTRVRVMAQSLRELIQDAGNVLIVGHKTADFDCLGSALALSRIVQSYNRTVCVVMEQEDLEAKLKEAYIRYRSHLEERHRFVSIEEAWEYMKADTLVIMTDHHDLSQCFAPEIIRRSKKTVVIDHHRRRGDFEFLPLLVYLEPSASSVCEMTCELFPYQLRRTDLSEEEATLMFTGMILDTNNFRSRTGSRTFEAASELRKYGADPQTAADLIKEDFDVFEIKTDVLKYCEKYDNGIIIVPYQGEKPLSRAILSQVANELLEIADVEAVFVFARIDQLICGSARSNGNVNVQLIFEKMQGGGHFTQAGLQRQDTTVEALKKELLDILEESFREKEELS